ncbi:MAG: nucleoside triphosphate pyrophosphohydrolase [Gemmatimonadota bacterium]
MQHKATLEDTLALMRDLRARCEWDAAQTHHTLRPYLIEEAHELDEALLGGDDNQIRDELGDVLLQVLFHSVVAEERGAFGISDVAGALVARMRHRHPHLYGDGERVEWEKIKAARRASIGDGLPAGLPALHRAHRLQDRAAAFGFDWNDPEGPADKVSEELAEVRPLLGQRGSVELEAELGDLLFTVVNLCRKVGVHASLALDVANARFLRRFSAVEELARERGLDLATAGLVALDRLWDEVKAGES